MLQVKLEKPTTENSCSIELTQGKSCIVSKPFPVILDEYIWVAVKWNFRWYAYSWKKKDGTRSRIAMHRLLAHTPRGEICHHRNTNTLDNRDANFHNMSHRHHKQLHGIRRYGRKNKHKTTIGKHAKKG